MCVCRLDAGFSYRGVATTMGVVEALYTVEGLQCLLLPWYDGSHLGAQNLLGLRELAIGLQDGCHYHGKKETM